MLGQIFDADWIGIRTSGLSTKIDVIAKFDY